MNKQKINVKQKTLLIRLIVALVLWLTSIIFYVVFKIESLDATYSINEIIILVLIVVSFLIAGYDIIFNAIKKIFKGNFMSEDFLMTVASLAAFGLRFLGHREYLDAVAIMIFYQVGELFQSIINEKNKRDIVNTMNLKVTICHTLDGEDINPNDVNIDDVLVVKVGEIVPVDGISLNETFINKASLNGEALDEYVNKGDVILSGSIVNVNPLTLKVTKKYTDSTACKILELVENATIRKTKTEKFISKFAKIYTPIVIVLAILVGIVPPIIIGSINGFSKDLFYNYLYVSILCLVVSCPCALVVSVPLTYFSSIGLAAKHKIIIKGSTYLDKLANTKTIAMDKTGTLTKAEFQIKKVNGDIIEIAKGLEKNSLHPLAIAINKAEGNAKELKTIEVGGLGIIGYDEDNTKYLIGSLKFMEKENIELFDIPNDPIVLFVAKNKTQIGSIVLSDTLKDEAKDVVKDIKDLGIDVLVLSGDNERNVKEAMSNLGIANYHSNLLPDQKIELFDNVRMENKQNKKTTVYVGDGINDAPTLSLADVGVSMGVLGSDSAIEASDIVVLNDNLTSIPKLIKIAKKTRKLVVENIIISIGIKVAILVLALISNLFKSFTVPMELAIFGDVGVLILVILNALRALKIKK